jgi:hypothetical protein
VLKVAALGYRISHGGEPGGNCAAYIELLLISLSSRLEDQADDNLGHSNHITSRLLLGRAFLRCVSKRCH